MIPKWKPAMILLAALLAGITTTVAAFPYGSRVLKVGLQGDDVLQLQLRLRDLGYLQGPLDGKYGSLTRDAVAAFQRDYGLAVSGQAGRWTITSMDRSFAWRNSTWYAVQKGDTLEQVARRFATRAEVIGWMNQLTTTQLYVGQVLRVPVQPDPPPAQVPESDPGQPVIRTVPPPDEEPAPPPMPEPPPQPPQPEPPPSPVPGLPPLEEVNPVIMGYYVQYWPGDRSSLDSMAKDQDQLNLVISFQYTTDAAGNLTGPDFPDLMKQAADRGIHVFALIHNWDDQAGGFNRSLVRQMLATADSRERAASRMVEQVVGKGFSGINIDLENVPPAQRAEYTDLIARLAAKLKAQGMYLTLSIPAKTRDLPADGWSGAFDYAALAPLVDMIVIMSYDQHSPGFAAGPVASYEWVDQVMAYAKTQIPKEKILMGIAAYAYDWIEGTGTARAIGVPQAQQLAAERGARIHWDDVAQVPYFRYTDDRGRRRIVYFEDAASTQAKLKLVRQHGLRGIGIWRLGLEDPQIWTAIKQELGQR